MIRRASCTYPKHTLVFSVLCILLTFCPGLVFAQGQPVAFRQFGTIGTVGGGSAGAVALSPVNSDVLVARRESVEIITPTGMVTTLAGHEREVIGAVYFADGLRALTSSIDETARLWDLTDGREIRTFSGHTGFVQHVAVSHDDSIIMTASTSDNTIRIWSADRIGPLQVLDFSSSNLTGAALSPDGSMILTSENAQFGASLWDTATGNFIRSIESEKKFGEVGFGPGGREVYLHNSDGVEFRNVETGALRLAIAFTSNLYDVVLSPSGRILAGFSALIDEITFFDTDTGEQLLLDSAIGHAGGVYAVAFSEDDKQVLTAGGEAILWSLEDGSIIRRFPNYSNSVGSAKVSEDESLVLTEYALWDASNGEFILAARCKSRSGPFFS